MLLTERKSSFDNYEAIINPLDLPTELNGIMIKDHKNLRDQHYFIVQIVKWIQYQFVNMKQLIKHYYVHFYYFLY